MGGMGFIEANRARCMLSVLINTHLLMAASVIALLPVLLLYFIAQKQFTQGIATTGLKG